VVGDLTDRHAMLVERSRDCIDESKELIARVDIFVASPPVNHERREAAGGHFSQQPPWLNHVLQFG
jgi:hypothetical protein